VQFRRTECRKVKLNKLIRVTVDLDLDLTYIWATIYPIVLILNGTNLHSFSYICCKYDECSVQFSDCNKLLLSGSRHIYITLHTFTRAGRILRNGKKLVDNFINR